MVMLETKPWGSSALLGPSHGQVKMLHMVTCQSCC